MRCLLLDRDDPRVLMEQRDGTCDYHLTGQRRSDSPQPLLTLASDTAVEALVSNLLFEFNDEKTVVKLGGF